MVEVNGTRPSVELSARPRVLDRLAADVAARATHDLSEHRRKPRSATGLAPVELHGPVWPVLLARRAYKYLSPARRRPDPLPFALVRIVRRPAAQVARRPVLGRDAVLRQAHDTRA